MRKLLLCAVLASLLCGAGIAGADDSVPSETVSGFGLLQVYSTDHPVILRADGEPYYSNVTKFVGIDVGLAAKIKNGYSGEMPKGTLTAMNSGIRYMLTPNETYGNLCEYDVQGVENLASFAGQKVMWNLYTSPDVIVGAAVIPENFSHNSIDIADNEIVPYVKLNHESRNSTWIGRVDLYFVRSGDSKPVALGDTSVNVYINGSSLRNYSRSYEFTNFNKPVRNSFYLDWNESSLESMTVEYIKDGAKYIWNFTPAYGVYSSIEWGKLALENQPLTLKTGESIDIEIKIPARYDLSEYFIQDGYYDESYFLSVGNQDVLGWETGSLSFDQGSASWDGLTYNEEKSTLSFTLTAGTPGRTTLRVYIPNEGSYYREVHVTDESGDLVLSGDVPEGMYMQVSEYGTRARFINGRPWYPSAENDGMVCSLVINSDDIPYDGYLGMTNGSKSEVHNMWRVWDSEAQKSTNIYRMDSGARYNTVDSSDNTEYASLNITEDAIENANIWVEFPDNPSFNVVSASLKSLIASSDYMTTAEQLENFVPYFEMKHDPDYLHNVVSMDWCFVNPKTMQKVSPDVSNVRIYYNDVEGTSGTISYPNTWHINFQYDFNGVTYTWDFYEMDYHYYGYISPFSLTPGASKDVSMYVYNYSELDSIELNIWDTDILSADPVSFAPAETISFDVFGLKEGNTRLALVYTIAGYSSYDKYVQGYTDIAVLGSDLTHDLTPSFMKYFAYASIVEGLPANYTIDNDDETYISLSYGGTMTSTFFYDYVYNNPVGTIHFYSGDLEISSSDISLNIDSYFYDNGTQYVTLSSPNLLVENHTTRVVWTPSTDFITSGSTDIPAGKTQDYRPYVKLNRDGLNVSTLDYYFVDSHDNKIASPDTVSNIRVNVYTDYGSSFYDYGSSFHNQDTSGSITLNIPEVFINQVYIYFTDGGIEYGCSFAPVDKPAWSLDASDTISWDVDAPELPLVMYVGDSLDVTMTAPNIYAPVPYIGNSEIVAIDVLNSADHTVTVRLTAKSAGMTSITLASSTEFYRLTFPREIWVADADGKVPHLTGDGTIDDIIGLLTSDDITSDSSGSWYKDDDDSGTTSSDVASGLETSDPIEVLEGLSVYPRYALPTDPSGDAYSQAWDKVYNENLSYGAYMFEDDVEVLASRDALTVFNKLSADLIARYPAQLPAVVLPEIDIQANGIYTFRIPADNITRKGSKIFMHTYHTADYGEQTQPNPTPTIYIPEGIDAYSDGNNYITALTYNYSVHVDIDADTWHVRSSDVYLPDGFAFAVEDVDDESRGILSLRIYAEDNCFEAYEASTEKNIYIQAYNREEDYYIGFGWAFSPESSGMNYYDDEGTELEYISGDEYINVAVYLDAGRYAPVITAEATSKDIQLIRKAIGDLPKSHDNPPAPPAPTAFTLAASPVSLSVRIPATATVTLTHANAYGNVTYMANYSWVTFSGNTAMFRPTAPGTYRVTITATDSGRSTARTASAVIMLTVTGGTPASGDVKPASGDVSPDIRPASPDVPPVSPDIKPASPDVKPASGDVSPDVKPVSPDVPPVSPDIRPVSPDVPPASPDIRPTSPDTPVNPPVPTQSGDQPTPTPTPTPGGDQPSPTPTPTPGGDQPTPTPGGDSGTDTPSDSSDTLPATPAAPSININNPEMVQKVVNILQAISGIITGNVEVSVLPESAAGGERTIDDVSDEELAAIPEGQTPAVVLPIITVDKAAVYVFSVSLSNLRVGAPIFLHMMAEDYATGAEFGAAASRQQACTFLNDAGEEVTTVPANKTVNVAAYMEPGKSYAPLITTGSASSGGNSGGNSGDNSGGNTGDNPGTETKTEFVGSSGGGCDAGLSFMALAVIGLLTKKRIVK